MNNHDFADMPQVPAYPFAVAASTEIAAHAIAVGDWNLSMEESEAAERHIRSIAAGLTQRCAQAGFRPIGYELAYWLHDADATNNSHAILRWVRRMLHAAPDLGFTDKIHFLENRLQALLDEAHW